MTDKNNSEDIKSLGVLSLADKNSLTTLCDLVSTINTPNRSNPPGSTTTNNNRLNNNNTNNTFDVNSDDKGNEEGSMLAVDDSWEIVTIDLLKHPIEKQEHW
jgi:hypothetical protein